MAKLWRCEICGDPYIGDAAPANCPFCGAKGKHIKEFKDAKVTFDVNLNEKDKKNAEEALMTEVKAASLYFCAANKTDDDEGKILFKALGKIETEHASVFKKILKLSTIPTADEPCFTKNRDNLEETKKREIDAVQFYKRAASEATNDRIKQIFLAFMEVEADHLVLANERLL